MLAGQMIQILDDRPQGIASSWALLLYLGGARDKKLFLDPARRLNIAPWLTLLWKFTGFVISYLILGSLSKLPFLCTVTTRAPLLSHQIPSFTTAPSTLMSTVISPVRHMKRRSF